MGQSKLKEQRRLIRNRAINLIKGKSEECDKLLNNSKIKTKVYDVKESLKIKNDKPDYITFYNSKTGKILYTAKGCKESKTEEVKEDNKEDDKEGDKKDDKEDDEEEDKEKDDDDDDFDDFKDLSIHI